MKKDRGRWVDWRKSQKLFVARYGRCFFKRTIIASSFFRALTGSPTISNARSSWDELWTYEYVRSIHFFFSCPRNEKWRFAIVKGQDASFYQRGKENHDVK